MGVQKKDRYDEVERVSKRIGNYITQCQKFFHAHDGTPEWEAYLEFIDDIITRGLLRGIASSMGYFLDETDPTLTHGVLFEVRLELSEPDIIFEPALDKSIVGNFFDQVNGYCDDMFHMAVLIPRVASHLTREGVANNYLEVVSNHKELRHMKDLLMGRYILA